MGPERLIRLNHTALAVLRRCDGGSTIDELVSSLSAEFASDGAAIKPDVVQLLTGLARKRLIEI
jgi:pyrroloquinoline quinone biosynthesis protein D